MDLENINIQSILSLNKLGNKKIKDLNHMKNVRKNVKNYFTRSIKNDYIKINY